MSNIWICCKCKSINDKDTISYNCSGIYKIKCCQECFVMCYNCNMYSSVDQSAMCQDCILVKEGDNQVTDYTRCVVCKTFGTTNRMSRPIILFNKHKICNPCYTRRLQSNCNMCNESLSIEDIRNNKNICTKCSTICEGCNKYSQNGIQCGPYRKHTCIDCISTLFCCKCLNGPGKLLFDVCHTTAIEHSVQISGVTIKIKIDDEKYIDGSNIHLPYLAKCCVHCWKQYYKYYFESQHYYKKMKK